MATRLFNVRLDKARQRKARALRARGVVLSDLVREAIDREFDSLTEREPGRAAIVMQAIFAEHPDPPDLPPRTYDVHDRRDARKAILTRLRRKP